ncbi:MAG: hypothetical protein QXH30_01825 [Candidatus Bilamarchaeaceae archaeon]
MRGQASIEYLILFSVGLALIAFSVGALAMIKTAESQLADLEKARIAAAQLRGAGDEACALGDGNAREIELGWSVELECGSEATVKAGGQGAGFALEHCEISCSPISGKRFAMRNEGGEIKIEKWGP